MDSKDTVGVAQQAPVAPMPSPALVQALVDLGYGYARYDDLFEVFNGEGDVVFMVNYQSWQADPVGCDDNLWFAVQKSLRRRRRRVD